MSNVAPVTINADFPPALACLMESSRYIVLYGGRGAAKSWGVGRRLLLRTLSEKIRILCAREIQNSIKESVHKLLKDQIEKMGLSQFFEVQKDLIRCTLTNSEFFFEGIKHNVDKIKSYEGIDVCWVEEAHLVTENSWNVLVPTIRKPGSQIIVTFNTGLESDETYQRFVVNRPKNSIVKKISWRDNPWFSQEMKDEMEDLKARDYDAYLNVWEGHPKQILEGAVYKAELRAASVGGRIGAVPYDPTAAVHTFWDLGYADKTAIWFAQIVGFEYRVIDYYENSLQGIDHYLKVIQSKDYLYGDHWFPHDARAKQLGTGRSIEELVRSRGFHIRIIPRHSVTDGINAVRTIFPLVWFDEARCAIGLKALRSYRYELMVDSRDDAQRQFSAQPLHDWASHAADAFRYLAMGLKQPKQRRGSKRTEAVDGPIDQYDFDYVGPNYLGPGNKNSLGWMNR